MKKLWEGRFKKETNKLLEKFNASILFDSRMSDEDIKGSIIHSRMLAKQDIISAEEQKEIETQIKDSNIKRVLDDEKFQFKFDSGYYMETINSNKLSDIPFSLKYHKNKTSNIDEFIDSVSNFLQSANVELTESDINKLRKHYQKYK